MKKYNVIFNILTVLAYFYGVLLCSSLVLIPLGVYAIISAHRYSEFSGYTEFQFSQNKKRVKNWVIFACVLYFPVGLISLICLPAINNDIVVETPQEQAGETQEQPQNSGEPVEVEIHTPTTAEEKAEKLAKLEKFKEKGLITEEEFEQAKQQLKE